MTDRKAQKRRRDSPARESGPNDDGPVESKLSTNQRLAAISAAGVNSNERNNVDYLNPDVADRQFEATLKAWSKNAEDARQKEQKERCSRLSTKSELDEFKRATRVSDAGNIDFIIDPFHDYQFDDETFVRPDPGPTEPPAQYIPVSVPMMYYYFPLGRF
ncbi:hypothetical protein QR680_004563 [Steinernema hermaphroditum]|uniref:Uncharacterized protein n=1 Tax=Steinernema hermaphroditum TaxID=289476 RepID=A0AA39LU72_9BILA|nr:hypothetical protein QR680_004563 [Steinernema hermaphroditum]